MDAGIFRDSSGNGQVDSVTGLGIEQLSTLNYGEYCVAWNQLIFRTTWENSSKDLGFLAVLFRIHPFSL
ncbi:hypothetical protein VNO77_32592 [Canavalia gladiata]|uniref:Uncharacterized protein n=1 Tax=Canavalia gladiata TaxID=3824 RepID=A0AAN9Q559_CANGL